MGIMNSYAKNHTTLNPLLRGVSVIALSGVIAIVRPTIEGSPPSPPAASIALPPDGSGPEYSAIRVSGRFEASLSGTLSGGSRAWGDPAPCFRGRAIIPPNLWVSLLTTSTPDTRSRRNYYRLDGFA
jgi:hypothetical protein